MARPIRIAYENASYHVFARGNEKRPIFYSDRDRIVFIRTVAEAVALYDLLIHAYALMPNHYHLACTTPHGNLSEACGWIQKTYAVRFNTRHVRVGHLFQGRFHAILVESDSYAKTLINYDHLNIVRPEDKQAPIPREAEPQLDAYRWSSHRAYAGLDPAPPWLDMSWLSYWGSTRSVAHANYRREISQCFGRPCWNPAEDTIGGLVLGSEEFFQEASAHIEMKRGQEEIRWTQRESLALVRQRIMLILEGLSDDYLKIWMRIILGREPKGVVARDYGYTSGTAASYIIKRLEGDPSIQSRLHQLRRMVYDDE